MTTSKTTLKSLIAVAAFGAALTGLAANADALKPDAAHQGTGMQLKSRVLDLRGNINEGRRDHKLTDKEATRLTGRLNDIVALQQSYERSKHGLDSQEAATLNDKLNQLASDIREDGQDSKDAHHG